LQACLAAPVSGKEKQRIRKYLKPLTILAYQLTLPTNGELIGDNVITLMDAMSTRYATSMNIDPAAISAGHRALIAELFE